MPILRALPSTILIAASSVFAFKSSILVLTISKTCAFVSFPTLFFRGLSEPFWIPAAFLIKSVTGGFL